MAPDTPFHHPPAFASVALRHPEKAHFLGRVFEETTNSYKLVWFLAVLSMLKRSDARAFRLADVLTEMAVAAWHPVCLFRLSLGRQDKLQDVVMEIHEASGLRPNAAPDAIRRFVEGSSPARGKLDCFKRYVPTRFLTPWFEDDLRGTRDTLKDAKIKTLSRESQKTPVASPYHFEGSGTREAIQFNDSWRMFLMENLGIVESFGDHQLALYLQSRNPSVPGVVNKLRAPTARQLESARKFWLFVRADFDTQGKASAFRDIYSERQLAGNFAIDHFLPWTFVAHDLLWNLTPVELATNSSKSDSLPDLDVYLPRLAKLHFAAIDAAKKRPRFLEDYAQCFKQDAAGLVALGENGLNEKYREVMVPQTQIAINQGFHFGWKNRAPALLPEAPPRNPQDAASKEVSGPGLKEPGHAKRPIEIIPIGSGTTPGVHFLPFVSLKAAAGGFLGNDAPEPEGWVDVAKHGFSKRLSEGMFVTQVVGESMQPTIRDGSYCVFRGPVEGTRQGRVVLVQNRSIADPDTGGSYTVKRYRSAKANDEDGWRHESIQLIPDNPDRERFPILLFTPDDDADLLVKAEFIQMLTPMP